MTGKTKINDYNEDAIYILEGLEAVRKRPGMYIGSTDVRGLHHLVYEIIDNSVDESLAGFGDEISVVIKTDNSVCISDNGRGIPTGLHRSGKSTPEVIFTVLHAGGKFGQGGYTQSGGLHGVGASVVNALSEWLIVTIKRDGIIYRQKFEQGGSIIEPLQQLGKTKQTGTSVHFKPDPSIFTSTIFDYNTLSERLRESAFLLKGLKITISDERSGKNDSFFYRNGIQAYVEYINNNKSVLHQVVYFSGKFNNIEIECSFQYNDGYNENILSFVNNVRTKDGGTHEAGLKSALTRIFNEYARRHSFLKERDKNLEGTDIREGLATIISIRMPEYLLQFEGQTKGKLGTSEARSAVENFIFEQMGYYFNENPEIAVLLCQKAIKSLQVREAARKAREEARNGKKKRKSESLLSGKLTPAQSKNSLKNELFLVEGDSAGGSAKQGRDRKFQAILPLRGKILNTEKAKLEDILKNEEIKMIVNAIGGGIGSDFSLEDTNYNKIIIMTDADTDGAHIQVLLLTFFFRYMKKLIEAGKIYIALPPLYKVSKGTGKREVIKYAWSERDLPAVIKEIGKGYILQRYKGLGEMNADQLWETTMDPEKRTIIKVRIDDFTSADRHISTLMGDKAESRRQWIENNVKFGLEEQEAILDKEGYIYES